MSTHPNTSNQSTVSDEQLESALLLRTHIRRSVETHDDPIFTIDVMRAVMQERRNPSLLRRLWKRTPMIGIVIGCFTLGFLSGHVSASTTNVIGMLQSIPWSSLANSTLAWLTLGAAVLGVGVWQMER
jgi:hypothetical protein